MGIFTGILCFLCFLLLLAKAVSRKFGLKKADRLFMKLHKPLSAVLFLLCPVHIFFVLRTPRAIWLSQTARLPRATQLSQTARLPGYLSGGCLFLCNACSHASVSPGTGTWKRHRRRNSK